MSQFQFDALHVSHATHVSFDSRDCSDSQRVCCCHRKENKRKMWEFGRIYERKKIPISPTEFDNFIYYLINCVAMYVAYGPATRFDFTLHSNGATNWPLRLNHMSTVECHSSDLFIFFSFQHMTVSLLNKSFGMFSRLFRLHPKIHRKKKWKLRTQRREVTKIC